MKDITKTGQEIENTQDLSVGNVMLDSKLREVLIGLGNKVTRHLKETLVGVEEIPNLDYIWKECIGMMNSMSRFIRNKDGLIDMEEIDWDGLVNGIELTFNQLSQWQGILHTAAASIEIGRMLLASIGADIIDSKNLEQNGEKRKKLVPQEIIDFFRYNYERKYLYSMRGAFSNIDGNEGEFTENRSRIV